MAVTLETLSLLSDRAARMVFDGVVRERTVKLGDLVRKVSGRLDERTTIERLDSLERAGLVNVSRATLPEWNVYYVTADGLELRRKMEENPSVFLAG